LLFTAALRLKSSAQLFAAYAQVSKAAAGLCTWVHGIDAYSKVEEAWCERQQAMQQSAV
jgi:membrane protein YqaA with SNARE-associated domain